MRPDCLTAVFSTVVAIWLPLIGGAVWWARDTAKQKARVLRRLQDL